MAAPTRRQARDRRRRAKRLAACVAVVLVVALYEGPVSSLLRARDDTSHLRADVAQLQQRHAGLQQQLRTLRSDAAVVALARCDGFIFPGETPYHANFGDCDTLGLSGP
jgi:cell division protein FtsB